MHPVCKRPVHTTVFCIIIQAPPSCLPSQGVKISILLWILTGLLVREHKGERQALI